ncbi:uncharacterized protein LOC122624978 [Drosophila teissieri]|uniref:uncharacterized protein LOC122624978 n=1 Tax=Drosophila teissieri TaxID=7243 RepID=UPI001CBA4201|nr:uncharacterized protein LOC122624978 [Drosophila teissieri]
MPDVGSESSDVQGKWSNDLRPGRKFVLAMSYGACFRKTGSASKSLFQCIKVTGCLNYQFADCDFPTRVFNRNSFRPKQVLETGRDVLCLVPCALCLVPCAMLHTSRHASHFSHSPFEIRNNTTESKS